MKRMGACLDTNLAPAANLSQRHPPVDSAVRDITGAPKIGIDRFRWERLYLNLFIGLR